jgi:hypothetical protein
MGEEVRVDFAISSISVRDEAAGVGAVPSRGNRARALPRSMATRVAESRPEYVSSPAANNFPAATGANGKSDPKVMWPGFANASRVGNAAALDDSAVSK